MFYSLNVHESVDLGINSEKQMYFDTVYLLFLLYCNNVEVTVK